jgi:hypothetical protein
MFQKKDVGKNMHFICSFFFKENRIIYEKMRKNVVGPGGPQVTV